MNAAAEPEPLPDSRPCAASASPFFPNLFPFLPPFGPRVAPGARVTLPCFMDLEAFGDWEAFGILVVMRAVILAAAVGSAVGAAVLVAFGILVVTRAVILAAAVGAASSVVIGGIVVLASLRALGACVCGSGARRQKTSQVSGLKLNYGFHPTLLTSAVLSFCAAVWNSQSATLCRLCRELPLRRHENAMPLHGRHAQTREKARSPPRHRERERGALTRGTTCATHAYHTIMRAVVV